MPTKSASNSEPPSFGSFRAELPPVLSIEDASRLVSLGRTSLYALASAGEIQSLTLGAPGSRGKRAFLTDSLIAYINRRVEASPTPASHRRRKAAPQAA